MNRFLRFMALAVVVSLGLTILPSAIVSQELGSGDVTLDCGTQLKPADIEAFLVKMYSPPPENPLGISGPPYCIPCAIHIVRRSDGTGGISMAQLEQAIQDANDYFANTGMSFYILSIDYIDDDDYYYNVDTEAEENALRGENVVSDAINMYFIPNYNWCGMSSFTTSPVQGIIYNNGCVGVSYNPSTFPHEIGHYFDLYHTHETAFGAELVDGSNCASAGDLLCDTPADPGLDGTEPGKNVTDYPDCVYYGTETDANGDSYDPDTHQMMSYAPKRCRDDITPMGEARAVATLLNDRPNLLSRGCWPTADAGPDQVVECTLPAGTPVQMDGSGSSDPDGDPLTYTWNAPGITFDDPTLVNPMGTFPLGVTVVTLIVSDGTFEDTATVDIDVVDTTPPVVSCPPDIVIECADFCGTPAGDPQLDPFWAGVSATDICDAGPNIENDAPDCFSLGSTTVTFTATDGSGNSSSCQADVIVVDTTPPEITVELDRDVLWPPNHKMAEINASVTVTDICCENPTFELVSITSSEPDNGKGDGNTTGDIEIVDDTTFNLRSERRGKGDGRVYTVIHRATDCSGNQASDTTYVRVPHDMSGRAMASSGFSSDGTTLNDLFDKFILVIPSEPDVFDAMQVDWRRAYVGNVKGIVKPDESVVVDINGDGYDDLAIYYSKQATEQLIEASSTVDDGQISRFASYGPVGLHYTDGYGRDYLVDDIFSLGTPVILRITIPRSVDEPAGDMNDVPAATGITSIYPNPFKATTTVGINLTEGEKVKVRIFDTRGVLVRTLEDGSLSPGAYYLTWDGVDEQGRTVSAGIYFVNMVAGDFRATRKIVLLR